MHEMSLMENVLGAVRKNAAQMNINKVQRIKLVVGKLSMAMPDSLRFAFEALKQDALFKEAVLDIEEKPIICRCSSCEYDFQPDEEYNFICSRCDSGLIEIVSGRELYIDCYEGE